MFLFEVLQSMKVTLSMILAYGFSVTIAGSIKAWVAKKAGDYTPEHTGFLTLDPIAHIDPIGMLFMLFAGFGWGRYITINPHNINPPYRDIKIISTYYTTSIVHILLSVLSILTSVGVQVISTKYLGETAIGNTILGICSIAMGLNIALAMLRFIQSSVDLIFIHIILQKNTNRAHRKNSKF